MPHMPTTTRAVRARRSSSAWLIWPFGVLVLIVCALAVLGRRPLVFVPPAVNIRRREDHSLGVPAMNPWDAWTGSGDPRMLRNWVAVVGVLAFAALVAAGVVVAVRHLRARRTVGRSPVEPEAPQHTFDRVAATRAMSDSLEEALARVGHDTDTDDAIVACWHALEHAAADHGLPREAAETSTEYAVRLADRLEVSADTVRILAGLYREARFSGHTRTPSARDSAVRLLTDLRGELAAAGGRA